MRARWQATRDAAEPTVLRWPRRSQADCEATGETAGGLRKMDAASAGRCMRGVGDGGVEQPRNGAQDVKKNGMTKRKITSWVIPPASDAEFVAHMEEVLETYAQAYDPAHPVLCMDEQPNAATSLENCPNH